jgi:integrase
VFPQAADRYARNPDGIYIAVKPYFARAVFGDEPEDVELIEDTEAHPRTIEEVLAGTRITEAKQARMVDIYNQLKSGKRSSEIATALGIARGQVSMYLAELEALTGEALRPKAKAHKKRENQRSLVSRTRGERGVGMRAASLYGWHSLRATFVVLAVEAGIPLEDIRKIVGHTTVEMTEEYYNPKEENVMDRTRKQMQERTSVLDGDLPAASTETAPAPIKPSLDDLLDNLTTEQRLALIAKLSTAPQKNPPTKPGENMV